MKKQDETQIELGRKYRDQITGFEGVAIARAEYLYGCTRVTLTAISGDDVKEYTFDSPSLVDAESGTGYRSEKTGGPRPMPPRRST
jgi:hypothetical protein